MRPPWGSDAAGAVPASLLLLIAPLCTSPRRRVARYLRRALNSSLTFAWLTWLELLAHLGKLRKFGKRLTHRGLGMAWASWQGVCEQGRRSRKLLGRVVNNVAVRAHVSHCGP